MPVTASPPKAMMTSPSRRPAVSPGLHQYPGRGCNLIDARDGAGHRNILATDADEAASDSAVANQPRGNESRRVTRNRETQSLRRQDDGGVDPDHLAAGRHERAAGVAGVERGVSLE